MAWNAVSPLWLDIVRVVWIDFGDLFRVSGVAACDALSEAMGTTTVSLQGHAENISRLASLS